jgi:hypothetical protein
MKTSKPLSIDLGALKPPLTSNNPFHRHGEIEGPRKAPDLNPVPVPPLADPEDTPQNLHLENIAPLDSVEHLALQVALLTSTVRELVEIQIRLHERVLILEGET